MTPQANGTTPQFRADIGLRIVADAKSYQQIGKLMDTLHRVLAETLANEHAVFDFTSFQTHPCKAQMMDNHLIGPGEYAAAVPERY